MTLSATLVEPAFRSVPAFRDTLGPEVADLCELAGFPPDPEQRLALDAMFAFGVDGKIAAFEFGIVCPRQNMKTGLFKQAALGWLFITEQRLIVWSAHEMKTTKEAFTDLVNLIENCPPLASRLAGGPSNGIHRGNGDESIELASGQRIMFKARTKGGGRGLTGDKVILDEAFALQAAHMGSLLPTLSARPDPQVVYGSSAGLADSDVLREIRDRGRSGVDPSLAYVEWCDDLGGECADGMCDHRPGTSGCILDDKARWGRANPQAGKRITWKYLESERRALPPLEFWRERLGKWDDPAAADAALPYQRWDVLTDAESQLLRVAAFAIDTTPDLSSTSIVAAGMQAGPWALPKTHVEVVRNGRGLEWAKAEAVALDAKHGPAEWVIDSVGPASALIDDLLAAGLNVRVVKTVDVARAFTDLRDAVEHGTIVHGPDEALSTAVRGAKKRPLGDGGYAIGRAVSSTVDITPIVGVELAHWAVKNPQPNLSPINNVW